MITKNVTYKNNAIKSKKKQRTFKKKDFYSGDGFLTSTWGPPLWHALHTISFNYPISPTSQQKNDYKNFIQSLEKVVPCKHCRNNLSKNFKRFPLTIKHMKNRDNFSRYIYNLHELVNKMLKKKSNLTYCDVRERYEHFRSRCVETQNKTCKHKPVKKEKGCTKPLHGTKSRCLIKFVPHSNKTQTIKIDNKCLTKRLEQV